MTSPRELARIAAGVLDSVAPRFVAGLGAPSAHEKGSRDFATEVDLDIERTVSRELEARTGIPVHGEEYGGADPVDGRVWVVDPIDGTLNYSAGLPTCGILLALLDDGVPVAGLSWFPLLGRRYVAVVGDGPVTDGEASLPPLEPVSLGASMVASGPLSPDSRGVTPGPVRVALFTELSRSALRVRIHGSTGFDLAYTAAGVLGAAVVFGHNVWDNAAGVALVRAAGGVVTDLTGSPWTAASSSLLAAAPGVHGEILDILDAVRDQNHRDQNR
ncbi:inositol-1(or 4)-monophosphatase [Rhodococcus rhodnii LMG 5362]|uniref:inositol-phosphate phosphatase n=1 Tax=Rhodococcus rhodnii LMG 5362 TaxID=1273125 RepID=R7WWQ4_9NOCA|nr:inositol-1(or 4)-monophosphatase [Rhodococcus rhodnii LMG 5362]